MIQQKIINCWRNELYYLAVCSSYIVEWFQLIDSNMWFFIDTRRVQRFDEKHVNSSLCYTPKTGNAFKTVCLLVFCLK